jgi:hypothetical protein
MFELKPIAKQAIPAALNKAERYRLLNEPREAESICRDILRADPRNQFATVMLLLAVTDQFGRGFEVDPQDARDILPQLRDDYERAYYAGVICERWGKALLARGAPGYDWFREAMVWYEQAEALSPPENHDAILRWNTCARTLMRHDQHEPRVEDRAIDIGAEDEVPLL